MKVLGILGSPRVGGNSDILLDQALAGARDAGAEAELLAGLPFINMELVDPVAFQHFTERTFASDRNLVPKGMVEVVP